MISDLNIEFNIRILRNGKIVPNFAYRTQKKEYGRKNNKQLNPNADLSTG
jgi:hypothetical protein